MAVKSRKTAEKQAKPEKTGEEVFDIKTSRAKITRTKTLREKPSPAAVQESAVKQQRKKKEKKAVVVEDKKTLVIVESPAKAKTIEKYLGPSYTVKASMGHLIDLPKSRMAIDVDHDFAPEYITVRGRAKLLKELQGDAKKSDTVLLASDNDREGEAIAWHLKNAITAKADKVPIQRIAFNEITPMAIKDAVAHPGSIDDAKVNAQKARRVLDRLVGYNLSPLLWKKVKNGLSAGRVQSVALRLICEREKEVESFIPEEYWTLEADFMVGKTCFTAQLVSWQGNKPELKNEDAVTAIIGQLTGIEGVVADIRELDKTVKPRPPFTTSQLQQTAANRLGFTGKKTMQVAQQLYEGVNLGSSRVGLITYMRTDSVRISQVALEEVRVWIGEHYPQDLPDKAVEYTVGKKAQDAHEAIRPTYSTYTPDTVKEYLSKDQLRLYTIIWERFVASQMQNAKTKTVSTDIRAGEGIFRIAGTRIIEKGFYQVMKVLASKEEKGNPYPVLKIGDPVHIDKFYPEQHFTQGPARYTDASIVKTLEEKGIGRPSTYAPIISVLQDRYYVTRSNKQLVPTLLGRLICDMLVEYFPHVVDTAFTASMENKLDAVEESQLRWPDMIREFYDPFKDQVEAVGKNLESFKGSLDEPTDYYCEQCGKPLVKKLGRFGYFLACTGFPECRHTRSIPLAKCPRCGGDIVARKTRGRGKEFYGCTNYPACDFISHFKPINQTCPQCGQCMVEKYDKKNGYHTGCINPACNYLPSSDDEDSGLADAEPATAIEQAASIEYAE
ncbi:MAG: type I DNA topoisomerase [Treponema sp.]|jgi:DNA topoisomerase-1|nr:type I DNA topoisomerase [Treponema sp.]